MIQSRSNPESTPPDDFSFVYQKGHEWKHILDMGLPEQDYLCTSFVTKEQIRRNWSDLTLKLYTQILRQFKKETRKSMDQVMEPDIIRYLHWVKKTTTTDESYNKYVYVVRRFFEWMYDEIEEEPRHQQLRKIVKFLRQIRFRKHKPYKDIMSKDEMLSIIRTIKNSLNEKCLCEQERARRVRDYGLFTLLQSTGMRVNEALHLEIHNISFEKSYVIIRKAKNNKQRIAYLTEECKAALQAYLSTNGHSSILFTLSNQTVNLRLKEWAHKANVKRKKGISSHQFRHRLTMDLMDQGMPVNVIQSLLGHEDPATTMEYARHLSDDVVRKHLQRVDPAYKLIHASEQSA